MGLVEVGRVARLGDGGMWQGLLVDILRRASAAPDSKTILVGWACCSGQDLRLRFLRLFLLDRESMVR